MSLRRQKAGRAAKAATELGFGATNGCNVQVHASKRIAGRGRQQMVDVSLNSGGGYSVGYKLAKAITGALDPVRAPGPVKRFSKDEIAKLNSALAKPEGKP